MKMLGCVKLQKLNWRKQKMKVSLILKIVGTLHVAVGGMLIYLLLFAHEMLMESMGADVSLKTFKTVQSTADVVGALNVGIGLLLIFCSYIKDLSSAKKCLLVKSL
tara:strand:- start:13 stop:330 length:318 start_codon:yes stop_codon:yes gene_type:complete